MLKIDTLLSRRTLIKRLALTASASSLSMSLFSQPASTKSHADITHFLSLSSLLTGIKLDASYMQLGQDILFLLGLNYQFSLQYESLFLSFNAIENHNQDAANTLLQHHPYVTKSILKAWYLSQVELTEQDRTNPLVQALCPNLTEQDTFLAQRQPGYQQQRIIGQINYDEALTWQACLFTKPSATCGGPFGYWQYAPANV